MVGISHTVTIAECAALLALLFRFALAQYAVYFLRDGVRICARWRCYVDVVGVAGTGNGVCVIGRRKRWAAVDGQRRSGHQNAGTGGGGRTGKLTLAAQGGDYF